MTLVLGAVAYDPKVVTIWEGFKDWFATAGLPFDFVLYSHYERQVRGHFTGEFHVAWNSPLAWLETAQIAQRAGRQASGFAMRDTDCDLTSVVVARAGSEIRSLQDLKGKTVAVGAPDSPQATLIPLQLLASAGLVAGQDFEVREFDVLFGKHGDHIGGERDAARALHAGEVDAACMIDGNHLLFSAEGTLPAGSTAVIAQTPKYDHCIFTALDGCPTALLARFTELLMAQKYEDPEVRPLLDLEGLKQWKAGRTVGFAQLAAAVDDLPYHGASAVRQFIDDTAAELAG